MRRQPETVLRHQGPPAHPSDDDRIDTARGEPTSNNGSMYTNSIIECELVDRGSAMEDPDNALSSEKIRIPPFTEISQISLLYSNVVPFKQLRILIVS